MVFMLTSWFSVKLLCSLYIVKSDTNKFDDMILGVTEHFTLNLSYLRALKKCVMCKHHTRAKGFPHSL